MLWLLCYTAGYFCTPLWRQAVTWLRERPSSAATTPLRRKNSKLKAGEPSGISAVTSSVIGVGELFYPVLTKARLVLIAKEVVSPRQVCTSFWPNSQRFYVVISTDRDCG